MTAYMKSMAHVDLECLFRGSCLTKYKVYLRNSNQNDNPSASSSAITLKQVPTCAIDILKRLRLHLAHQYLVRNSPCFIIQGDNNLIFYAQSGYVR